MDNEKININFRRGSYYTIGEIKSCLIKCSQYGKSCIYKYDGEKDDGRRLILEPILKDLYKVCQVYNVMEKE